MFPVSEPLLLSLEPSLDKLSSLHPDQRAKGGCLAFRTDGWFSAQASSSPTCRQHRAHIPEALPSLPTWTACCPLVLLSHLLIWWDFSSEPQTHISSCVPLHCIANRLSERNMPPKLSLDFLSKNSRHHLLLWKLRLSVA